MKAPAKKKDAALNAEILRVVRNASGPGIAASWEQWALNIKPDDARSALAHSVIEQVKEIRERYKVGDDRRAGTLIERLKATRYLAPLIEHAKDIRRAKKAQKALDDANAERAEDAGSLTRQVANFYKARCKDEPRLFAQEIYSEILSKFKITDRTLQDHLAKARRLNLIPKRHRRISS